MSSRSAALYLEDMKGACRNIQEYTKGFDWKTFCANSLVCDAVVRNLEILGEAAAHVPQDVRDRRSDIPWKSIIGLRNMLAHGYFHVDVAIVWEIASNRVPDLEPRIVGLLAELEDEHRPP